MCLGKFWLVCGAIQRSLMILLLLTCDSCTESNAARLLKAYFKWDLFNIIVNTYVHAKIFVSEYLITNGSKDKNTLSKSFSLTEILS